MKAAWPDKGRMPLVTITPRGDDRKALAELFETDYGSADALSGLVFKRAFELIQRRNLFTVLVSERDGVAVYGPFATPSDAGRSARSADFDPSRVRVGRMWAPELLTVPVLMEVGLCADCGHSKATHEHARGQGRCWALTADKDARGCACDNYVLNERMGS